MDGARSTGGEHGAMAIITNQDDDANKKIKSSDRRKRAAAAKRMKNAEPGGWKSLSVEDRQFLAEVFKTYDKDGTGTLGREPAGAPAQGARGRGGAHAGGGAGGDGHGG